MGSIADRLRQVAATLPAGVTLVAVSKFHPTGAIMEAYGAGQRTFGESRVQELLAKRAQLPADIEWHFIGHLQTNKVRQLVGCVSLIESIDSERLLGAVDAAASAAGVVQRVLLQVHLAADEEQKFGFAPDGLLDYFAARRHRQLQATHLCGLMGMASNTDDRGLISREFTQLADLRRRIVASDPELRGFDTLSMGMSGDRDLAIAAGSTAVRIGTDIFGPREY